MKFLPFVLKHLRRNWIRTAQHRGGHGRLHLPVLHAAARAGRRSTACSRASAPTRLVTRHAVSLVFNLPLSYGSRIQAVPGREARGHHLLVRRLAARQEGRQGRRGRRGRRRTGATSSRTWRWTRSRTSPCTPSSRSRPTSCRPSWRTCRAPSSAASWPTSSAGRSATASSWRASSRPTASGRAVRVRGARHLRRRHGEAPRAPTPTSCSSTTSTSTRARPAACSAGTYTVEIDDPDAGGRRQQGHRRAVREQRRPDPHRDRAGLRGRLHLHGRQPGAAAQRHRPGGELHHPARHRQHHEHGRARAAHRDRACSRRSASPAAR